ncbi:hypothetical protein O6P43_014949 [Quillaja saponaria]|uniref:Uncharacterized protein n=1 Tax=Quillaja saponaria TaxID=32244 RepID=A0AAD7PSH8_QUISA|nr:hypothetical protein O6P43_014949 [Quillaja saponaria]
MLSGPRTCPCNNFTPNLQIQTKLRLFPRTRLHSPQLLLPFLPLLLLLRLRLRLRSIGLIQGVLRSHQLHACRSL